MCWPQSRSGRAGKDKIFAFQNPSRPVRRPVATPTTLPVLTTTIIAVGGELITWWANEPWGHL